VAATSGAIILWISRAEIAMTAELSTRRQTTTLLMTAESGDVSALGRLVPIVYDELRAMAHRQLGRERRDPALQTTALVHEAYLKMVDDARVTRRGRAYFFAAAARAMRQVLIDLARRRKAGKRGGGAQVLTLEEDHIAVDEFAAELLDLDHALEQLAALNPRHAQVIECRFFAGMSVDETAAALDISPRAVKYDWAFARAWLYDALHEGHDSRTPA
jgi:RNA polymerase sigma-70 factor, ECF subfamily